jgi:hypothetical protein
LSSILELAKLLQQKSAADVGSLLVESKSSTASLADLFDFAKLLLSKRELERRIRSLPAQELNKLMAGEPSELLWENLLAGQAPFPEAVELAGQLEQKPLSYKLGQGGALVCYETLLSITELIFALEQSWFEVSKAGIRSADARGIAEKLHCPSIEIQKRFRLAELAGLVAPHEGRWAATISGQNWIQLEREQAWLVLARAIWDLPARQFSSGDLPTQLSERYPLVDIGTLKFLEYGYLIGLMDGSELLQDIAESPDKELAQRIIATLPRSEDRLILQGDLSIICPGPISPALHRELDSFADSEELGLASRFRISALSLSHHIETGGSLAAAAELLKDKSGRQLPQPLQYLLAEAESRFGSLQVIGGIRTTIRSEDQILLAQIANERSLIHLGLRPEENHLASQAGQEVVYFSLRAASYAAVMVNETGEVISPRLGIAQADQITPEADARLRAEQLIAGERLSGDAGDIRRQLQFALKNKIRVSLSFEDAQGKLQRIQLMPLGITDTRLRGRESVREAEQTLPLARIKSVLLD